jgi:hypothetical protein
LADRDWRAVEIGPHGWKVVAEPPVRFRRLAGLLPLPMPQPGGSLDELAACLNLQDRDDLVLVTTWVLAAVRPGGPYPLLVIAGEQGSAKTVLSKMLRALVDPNASRTIYTASWRRGRTASAGSVTSTSQPQTIFHCCASCHFTCSLAEKVAWDVNYCKATSLFRQRLKICLDENLDGLAAGINLDTDRRIAKIDLMSATVVPTNNSVGH